MAPVVTRAVTSTINPPLTIELKGVVQMTTITWIAPATSKANPMYLIGTATILAMMAVPVSMHFQAIFRKRTILSKTRGILHPLARKKSKQGMEGIFVGGGLDFTALFSDPGGGRSNRSSSSSLASSLSIGLEESMALGIPWESITTL